MTALSPATAARMKCQHPGCGGSLIPERDGKETRLVCLSCGREGAQPTNGQAHADILDWKAVAVGRLKAILAQIKAADTLRSEAEEIAAVLAFVQYPNAPELPWSHRRPRVQGPAGKRSMGRLKSGVTCARCGRVFVWAAEMRRQPDGTALCRKPCQEAA